MADFNNGYRNLRLENAIGLLDDLVAEADVFLIAMPAEFSEFVESALRAKREIEGLRQYGPLEISQKATVLAKSIEERYKLFRKELTTRRAIQEYIEAREFESYKPGEVSMEDLGDDE